MDQNKRQISDNEDGPGPAKRQKTSETEVEEDLLEPIEANNETQTCHSDPQTNPDLPSTGVDNACGQSKPDLCFLKLDLSKEQENNSQQSNNESQTKSFVSFDLSGTWNFSPATEQQDVLQRDIAKVEYTTAAVEAEDAEHTRPKDAIDVKYGAVTELSGHLVCSEERVETIIDLRIEKSNNDQSVPSAIPKAGDVTNQDHDTESNKVKDLTCISSKDVNSGTSIAAAVEAGPDKLNESVLQHDTDGCLLVQIEDVESEPLLETISEDTTTDTSSLLDDEPGKLTGLVTEKVVDDAEPEIIKGTIREEACQTTSVDAEREDLKENSKNITQDTIVTPVEDVDSKQFKEISSESISIDSTVISIEVDDSEHQEVKESTSEEATCDDAETQLTDFKQDELEGKVEEKQNDTVTSPLAFEVSAVEESKLEQQNEQTADITNLLSENIEIVQRSALKTESEENESPAVVPARKPDYPYRYLYRLLRSDEDPCNRGITAKDPNANDSVDYHVRCGSQGISSQFISTSANKEGAQELKRICRKTANPKIAKIDCESLSGVKYIDLSTDEKRSEYSLSRKAIKHATRFNEVLVIGYIPASHCSIVS